MKKYKSFCRWHYIALFSILILMAIGRIKLYGDLGLSVPTRDTYSFVSASEGSLLSWESMTKRRLFTTNLLYKIFTPTGGFQNIEPSVDTAWRKKYPGYDKIAIFQSLFSILGWATLALALANKIKNRYLKILSTVILLLFGFTPHVADWDSVLGSESLSFSLGSLALGFLIWLVFDIYEQKQYDLKTILLALTWFITFFLWTFTRDANLYAMFATSLMLCVTMVAFLQYRRSRLLVLLAIILFFSFCLGLVSSLHSERSTIQVGNVISEYVLPYPARADFMRDLGMPVPTSPSFEEWLSNKAPWAYLTFLIAHPGFTLTHFLVGSYVAFNPYIQSYFRAPDLPWRTHLLHIGTELHLGFIALLIAIILLSVLWIYACSNKSKDNDSKPWTWITSWIFLTGISTLFISIFGDTVALHRHAIISTTELRLLMWVLVIILSDLLLTKNIVQTST